MAFGRKVSKKKISELSSHLLQHLKNSHGFSSRYRRLLGLVPQEHIFLASTYGIPHNIYGFWRNFSGLSSFLIQTMESPLGSCQEFVPQYRIFSCSNSREAVLCSGHDSLRKNATGFSSVSLENSKNQSRFHKVSNNCGWFRHFGSLAAAEASTSDGLTVDGIIAKQWPILDESEGDWKSHAAAIAQSIHLIKKRLQWKKLVFRLDLLSAQLNKPDLWDDPVHAAKISREHGSLMGKMKEVRNLEEALLEHIDMIKLAREENDPELESVGSRFS